MSLTLRLIRGIYRKKLKPLYDDISLQLINIILNLFNLRLELCRWCF